MPAVEKVTRDWVQQNLPRRNAHAHKGTCGTLSVLAGSSRYRGAALLCADAALRTGAGIVRLASVEAVCAAAAVRLPCCTLLPLQTIYGGTVDETAAKQILALPCSAVLAGCGLGNARPAAIATLDLLRRAEVPLVLDADALNALAGHLQDGDDAALRADVQEALRGAKAPVVVTPHIGEMARLCQKSVSEVAQNQEDVAAAYAKEMSCTVVLKSYATVVALPSGERYLYDEGGNPGLAKGGSGDALAGIIASLLCQGLPAGDAAAAGVWLHGAAARTAADEWGFAGLSPADLPAYAAGELKKMGYL